MKFAKKYFFLSLFFLSFLMLGSDALALGPGECCNNDDDECDVPLACSKRYGVCSGSRGTCAPLTCSSESPCPDTEEFRASDGTTYPRYCLESEGRCSRNGDLPPETITPPPGPGAPPPSGGTRCVGGDSACAGSTEICILQPSVTGCGSEPNRCCGNVPCTTSSDCPDGRSCSGEWCQKGWATEIITPGSVIYDNSCYQTSDCFGGLACIANKCKYCNESGSDQSSWDNNCYPKTGGCQIDPSEPGVGRCGGQPVTGTPAPPTPATPTSTPYQYSVTSPKLTIQLPTLSAFTPLTSTGEPGNRYLLIPWIGEYIAAMYKYAIGITGVLAGIMIVIAGLIWLTAGGSAERVSTAKSYIEGALVGLVIALTSYVLLYAVNPKLTEFDALKVKFIERIEFYNQLDITKVDTRDPNPEEP